MSFKHSAILKLHTNVVIIRGENAYDKDKNLVSYDNDAVLLEASLIELRQKRNNLLAKTDWTANSDLTMSSAMTTYRQALRDATTGLDTVAKVEAYEFPTEVLK
tara:strand:- start:131 stop:442 length:312 start_codon:yes stop_codon:yes gene_type:complete